MRRFTPAVVLALALPGCLAQSPADECDGPDDPACSVAWSALSRPGNYAPSADALAAGSAIVHYDDVENWDGGAHCSGGITPGGRVLSTYLRDHFGGISSIGGYSCRQNTANLAKMSVHGSGRALDIMIPLSSGAADNDVGDEIANWLIANSTEIGIQYLIWDRSQWSGSRSSDRVRTYTGPNPHIDHIHAEITIAASNQATAWFTDGGPTRPPEDATPTDPPPPDPVDPPPPDPTDPTTPDPSTPPSLEALFVAQGSDALADTTGVAQFATCTGSRVRMWFELEDWGTADWSDVGDTSPDGWGRAVRLGVPSEMPDAFTGTTRMSVADASNPRVAADGPDCSDPGCRRTVFAMFGVAPSTPGVYRSSWRLVDETRAWFGPEMWLSFRVASCSGTTPADTGVDEDGDGVGTLFDCDDADPSVHPGASELCEDGIDADCDGIDPACDTPSTPTDAPPADDPGFDWSRGQPVDGRPHGIRGTCSASPGRGSAASLAAVVLGLALAASRRRRRRPDVRGAA